MSIIVGAVWCLICSIQFILSPLCVVPKTQVALYLMLIYNSLYSDWHCGLFLSKLFADYGLGVQFFDGDAEIGIALLAGVYFVLWRGALWPLAMELAYARLQGKPVTEELLAEGLRVVRSG